MKKNKQLRYEIRQRINKERGLYERKRHKIYLHFKNTGRLGLYHLNRLRRKLKGRIQKETLWQKIKKIVGLLLLKLRQFGNEKPKKK